MKNLITILCLCLFWGSCESPTDPEPEPSEIDVDWVLVKTLNMESGWDNSVGYYFYFTSDSNITNLNLEESCFVEDFFGDCMWYEMILNTDDGILSFTYNEEDFNFDVSDSYIQIENQDDPEIYYYLIQSEFNEPLQRIIYNQEMNYFTLFGSDGFTLNSSSPNELIDYR